MYCKEFYPVSNVTQGVNMNFDDLIFSKFDFSGVHKKELIPLIEEFFTLKKLGKKDYLV